MMSLKKILDKILSISSAGMPGILKLAAMFAFYLILPKSMYAEFSRNFSFANALLMLSGIAYSIMLYKKLNYNEEVAFNKGIFWGTVYSYSVWGTFHFCIVILIVSLFFDLDFINVFLWSFFTGLFFVARGYYIFFRKFNKLFFVDVLSLLLFSCVAFISYIIKIDNIFEIVSMGFFAANVVPLLFIFLDLGGSKTIYKNSFHEHKEICVIGWSNFTSMGIAFLIPLLIQRSSSDEFVIYSSIASLVFSIITVIPRGIINENIGDFSFMLQSKKLTQKKVYAVQMKVFYYVILLGAVTCILFILAMNLDSIGEGKPSSELYFYVILLCIFFSVGQLSIVEATLMYLGGQEKKSLLANIIITILCVVMSLLNKGDVIKFSASLIVIILIIFYLVRWKYYCVCVRHLIDAR